MTTTTRCAFCDDDWPTNQLRRELELDLCEVCASDPERPVATRRARGDAISTRAWETRVYRNKRPRTLYHMAVDVVPRTSFPATATFTREGAWARLKKLFLREVEVGDPIFDDYVHVGTRDGEATLALLQHTGVQASLMDLLAGSARVTFTDGAFEVYDESLEPVFPGTALLAVCAMLVHLERAHGE